MSAALERVAAAQRALEHARAEQAVISDRLETLKQRREDLIAAERAKDEHAVAALVQSLIGGAAE